MIIMEAQKKENISARGRKFTGTVASTKMSRTAVVVLERKIYMPKYERYQKRRTRIHAHIPLGMEVGEGDTVTVQETRPISKTKHFIIIKNHNDNSESGEGNEEKKEAAPKKAKKA